MSMRVHSGGDERSARKLALLAFAMLIISIDFNIVYVALPRIGHELNFSSQTLQWVVSGYAVTWGGFLLLGGRAVDRLGPRRMFVLALSLYGIASLVGGLAREAGWLVGARAVQGVGAAVLFPATLALINLNFAEGSARNRAMAVWGAASSSGLILGSTAGGLLTHFLGWPWVLLVNVPLTVVAMVGALRTLPPDPVRTGPAGGFDVPGALLATAGATLIVLGLVSGAEVGWMSVRGTGALVVGAALFIAFLLAERRNADVLMPPQLIRHRGLMAAIVLVTGFMTGINFLHYSFFIQLQDVLRLDAFRAGLAFIPVSVGGMLGSMKILPALLNRYGLRIALLVGVLGLGLSMAALAPTMTPDGSYLTMLPSTLLWGASAGIAFSGIFLAAGAGMAPTAHGTASAMASTAQQVGGTIGLAVLLAVASNGVVPVGNETPVIDDVVAGLRTGLWAGAGIVSVTAIVALLVPGTQPGAVREATFADEVPTRQG